MSRTWSASFVSIVVLGVLQTLSTVHAQQVQPSTTNRLPSIVDLCLKEQEEKDWPMSLYRNCVYKLEVEQAKRIKAQACNDQLCIYRLDSSSSDEDSVYRGHGYILTINSLTSGRNTAVLTGEEGKETILVVICGAATCAKPYTLSGAIHGATFKGPYPEGKTFYVMLQIPFVKQRVVGDSKTGASACENQGTLPCDLQSKTVDYRFNIDGEIISGFHYTQKHIRPVVEQLKFTKSDDVYSFQGKDDTDLLSENGYLYKFNQQIDFLVNRLRAPPSTSWVGVRNMNGTIVFEKDQLVRKLVSAGVSDGREWTHNWEVRIRFSKDFRTCSVVGFSWTGTSSEGPYKYQLKRAFECVVR